MAHSKPSSIDPKLVRELAEILKETELTEIEVERDELRIRVAREVTVAPMAQASAPVAAPAPAPAPAPISPPETPAPTGAADAGSHPGAVSSPMVGTAYLRPNPDSEQFVKPGDKVKTGDTVLLVEAMKTFNPITAPKDGVVADILVSDAQPVEFGEPLFILS